MPFVINFSLYWKKCHLQLQMLLHRQLYIAHAHAIAKTFANTYRKKHYHVSKKVANVCFVLHPNAYIKCNFISLYFHADAKLEVVL